MHRVHIAEAISANAARFSHAVRRIINGKVLNAGQTCIAPGQMLKPKDAIPRFIAEARDILTTQYPDGAAGTTSPASQRTGASPACRNSS